jgi:GT2 family glycosyltransferase
MIEARTANIVANSSNSGLTLCEPNPLTLAEGLALVICTYKRTASLQRFLDSLAAQDEQPDQLIIVDASPTDETEQMLRAYVNIESLADNMLYFRVGEPQRGLPRQRNFGLRWVTTDLVAFFDDDIVLLPGCLKELVRVHREGGSAVAGVGAFAQSQIWPPGSIPLWRVRLLLRMMSNLKPGRYYRSGVSTPWVLLAPTEELVEGDWLSGCAMVWKTAIAQVVGFNERFAGYALGEDLDFSLRVRGCGKLLVAGKARVLHLYEASGRPDHFSWGYMAIYNRYDIHRRLLPNRSRSDTIWFIYVWTLDTLLLARHFFTPGRRIAILKRIAGRLLAAYDLLCGR